MFRRHELIPSRSLHRPVHLWRYGHWGRPVIVFPTAAGFAHEWEAQGMLAALGDLVGGGHLKLYCTESNVAEAWTRRDGHPAERIRRHQAFEAYVVSELVPAIRHELQQPEMRLGLAGCSLGAFYAANFALKYPELFDVALCLSGRYDMTHFTGGFTNADVYFNNPLAYVPGIEGGDLERLQRLAGLILVCGQGPWEDGCLEETVALADLLAAKGIPHLRDIWGHDVSHEWPWWHRQARLHLERLAW